MSKFLKKKERKMPEAIFRQLKIGISMKAYSTIPKHDYLINKIISRDKIINSGMQNEVVVH